MNEISESASRVPAQPSPYTDRRALSEAWYRALYDARHAASRSANGARSAPTSSEAARASASRANSGSVAEAATKPAPPRAVGLRVLRAAFSTDGRARSGKPTAEVALRAAVRRAVWRRTLCRTTLPAGHAVDLLVQQRGDLLRLIAMYDGRDTARVSAALLRARTALVRRGLRVEVDARQKGTS